MTDVWLDGYVQVQSQKSGIQYLNGVAPKHCGHTVEGYSAYPESTAAAHPFTPQTWYCTAHDPYRPRLKIQCIPLNLAGYALAHPAGTPETNRAGFVQTEVFGYARETHLWPEYSLDAYVDDVIVPICVAAAIDPRNYAPTYGPESATASWHGRATAPNPGYWLNGLYTHQWVWANSHWDQGRINMAYVSARATAIMYGDPVPPPPPPADADWLTKVRYLIALDIV